MIFGVFFNGMPEPFRLRRADAGSVARADVQLGGVCVKNGPIDEKERARLEFGGAC